MVGSTRRARMAGVTLIELVVAMLIVGLLTSIAIPSYRAYTLRVHRSEAKVELTSLAQRLERCFTRYNRYDDADCTAKELPKTIGEGRYEITVAFPEEDGREFTLTATPKGAQANDTGCGALTLDQLGQRDKTGTKTVAECW